MTAEEFQEWLLAMKISAVEAAQLLGVKPNSITRYKKDGAPIVVGLACKFLREHHRREVNTVTRLAARKAVSERLKRA